jgi:3-hydroxyacyl-CoA dehydrogenase
MAERPIARVAVVGTGVIGASWAAYFLAQGLDVVATDPAPGAEERLRDYVGKAWPTLETMGLKPGASIDRLRFAPDLESCVAGADFVQENGPEREDIKTDTFRRLDAALPPDIVLSTSSSGYPPSLVQGPCRHPERVLVGHPFNPPHLIPLVEVVGGERTSEAAIETAMAFYAAIGKRPIRIRKELKGHVANRLQAALWQEAFHLVDIGAVTVEEVDAAISHGPGLRWALMGPMLLQELAGGQGGVSHALDHLGPLMERLWADLGEPSLDRALKDKLIAGVADMLAGRDLAAMVAERDRLLVELVAKKADTNLP